MNDCRLTQQQTSGEIENLAQEPKRCFAPHGLCCHLREDEALSTETVVMHRQCLLVDRRVGIVGMVHE